MPHWYQIGTRCVPDVYQIGIILVYQIAPTRLEHALVDDFPQTSRKLPDAFPRASPNVSRRLPKDLSKVSRQPHQEIEHRLHAIEMTFEGAESVSFLTFIHSLAPVQAATGGDADGGGRLGMLAVISFIVSDVLKAR